MIASCLFHKHFSVCYKQYQQKQFGGRLFGTTQANQSCTEGLSDKITAADLAIETVLILQQAGLNYSSWPDASHRLFICQSCF